ncbi:hypothetical protein [Serratia quinivorans]|uniref:hypothetical protein n=1 Tax=Serratia quinivorans TaxID=137545 RepID=UPI00217CAB98|nr:hypothetical protein [Serratia quinivorans]CAI1596900.1 Uncharacterised protein [Serratia quinivorans]CAI1676515.1 Uncharacterised protein [Serratia quinivorans]
MEQRIFLVDHDAVLRLSVTLLLGTLGWQVTVMTASKVFNITNYPDSLRPAACCWMSPAG